MIKKITALFLVLCMLFCFASCADEGNNSSSSKTSAVSSAISSSKTSSKASTMTSLVSSAVSSSVSSAVSSSVSSKSPSSVTPSSKVSSVPVFSQEPVVSEVDDTDYNAPTLRVMSYNILHPEWCSTHGYVPVNDRIGYVHDIIVDYAPDVIGLQEADDNWHSAINSRICNETNYKFACKKNKYSEINMTTFLYNSSTVNLIEENIVFLDDDDTFIRVLSVAVFERKSDGRRFVVTNTHPAPSKTQAAKYAAHFKVLPDLIKAQMSKYENLPFIMTGDFNTYEQDATYTKFMNATGVKDAKYKAKTLVKDYCTFSGFKVLPKPGNSKCIDHIFVNTQVGVKQFDVVTDHDVAYASDHIPIYADVILK